MLPEVRVARIVEAIGRYGSGRLSCLEAAEVLGMSERHFRRLRDRYEAEGAEGLIKLEGAWATQRTAATPGPRASPGARRRPLGLHCRLPLVVHRDAILDLIAEPTAAAWTIVNVRVAREANHVHERFAGEVHGNPEAIRRAIAYGPPRHLMCYLIRSSKVLGPHSGQPLTPVPKLAFTVAPTGSCHPRPHSGAYRCRLDHRTYE